MDFKISFITKLITFFKANVTEKHGICLWMTKTPNQPIMQQSKL